MILGKFRLILFLFCLMQFTLGCIEHTAKNGSETVNDTVVSENTMISLLADIHIIEAGLAMEKNEGTMSENKSSQLYQGLFRKYRITKKKYDSSLKFYHQNPKEFSKIYAKVIARIELEQSIIGRRRR